MTSLAIVPAAGIAERFGGEKLLANVGGLPMLERTVRSLFDGGVDRVVVVLGPKSDELRNVAVLADPRVTVTTNPDPDRGMISSIQAGLKGERGDPLLVLPGDMPYVEPATVAALLATYRDRGGIVSPRFEDTKRGHPVVIAGRLRDEILAAGPDATLHDVLKAHAGERVDLPVYDRGVIRDVDTRQDLEAAP